MNDKIIEELAKEIEQTFYEYRGFCQHKRTECPTGNCLYCNIATHLTEQGYRKIPNGSVVLSKEEKQKLLKEMYEQGKFDALADLEKDGKVVLSKEEYSDYLILQKNHEFIREKAKELQADNERLYKNIGKFKEIARKETAKEILSLAIKHDNGYETDMTRFISDLKKQLGVEVEE